MAKKKPAAPKESNLDKLLTLTRLMKDKKIRVSRLGPPRSPNKWRSEPKFAPAVPKVKPEGLVSAGGMDVDPSVAAEYEAWRKDKIAEQEERRAQALRKAKNKRHSF